MFSLKSTCNRIPVDKASINKLNNKSSIQSKSMKYSSYVNINQRNYKTISEGQVTSITMIYATPNTATIVYTYASKPIYVNMTLVNIHDSTDTQSVEIYNSPYTFTNLRPNTYYTINAYTTFVSTNTYLKVFPNAILTLNEGPPTDISVNNIQYNRVTLPFTRPLGNVTYVNLTLTNTNDITDIHFYPKIVSPFLITGLQPNITYDISICSFYSATQNTYTIYNPAFFQTYNENYPVIDSISNITNMGVTIMFEYTGFPIYNSINLVNTKDSTDTYTITETKLLHLYTFQDLHIDSSYNLTITSVYDTGHTYPTTLLNTFHTWNESMVSGVKINLILGTSIIIQYSPAVGDVLNYIVTLTDVNGNVTSQSYTSLPEYARFSNLKVYTNYTLTIVSNYEYNSYTYQYPEYIQTLNEGPVTDIFSNNVLSTSASISFPASPGTGAIYNITYQGRRNNTTIYKINGQTKTNFSLNNLSVYTPYTVTVTTLYKNNNSYSLSKINLFTTLNE